MNKLGQVNIILSDKKHCCFTSHRAINVNRSISVIVFESFVKFNADNWKAEIVGDNNFRVEVETCGEKHVEASGLKYLGGVALIIFIIIGGEKDNGSKRHAGFYVCHGYACHLKTKVSLTLKDIQKLQQFFYMWQVAAANGWQSEMR